MGSKYSSGTNVAIIFDDLTEFFVMRDAVDDLIKKKIPVDIIVPYDSGYNGLPEHTYNYIKNLGYKPKKDVSKGQYYKVLLTPYPEFKILERLKYTYHLKYPYGALSAKPNPTYLPEWKVPYDGIFSFNTYEPRFLKAYGADCYTVPYWKYHNFKKHARQSEKPNLLVLPTFGSDISCIGLFTDELVKSLRQNYHVISKAHHAVHFNLKGDDALETLKNLSDEFYDSDIPVQQLLQKADLVLSDNSGAIFEAICAGVPIALFAKSCDKRSLGIIKPLHCSLVEQKVIPCAGQAKDVLPMLKSIGVYSKKQTAIKEELFMEIGKNPVSALTDIIKKYLALDPETDYQKATHGLLVDYMNSSRATIADLRAKVEADANDIAHLREQLSERDKVISDIYNSTSWRITKPMRNIKQLGKKKGEKNG